MLCCAAISLQRGRSFGCQTHPSSGVHKTVTTACGTGHIFCAATSLQRGQASLATYETHFRINYVNVNLNTIGNVEFE